MLDLLDCLDPILSGESRCEEGQSNFSMEAGGVGGFASSSGVIGT